MKSKVWRLPLAALFAFACADSTAFADYGLPVVLTWTPPVLNDDGTPLLDLAGYYIYMGASPDSLIPAFFTNADVPRISLLFPLGSVQYFAVTAVNANGIESAMTPVVSNLRP
jgi:hypothetical protein